MRRSSLIRASGVQISSGYGSLLVVTFLRWAEAHGVRVIGGLPAGFINSPLSDDELTAIRAVLRDQGAEFLETPGCPRSAFFDTADHLNESAQISHSVAAARAWARVAGLRPGPVAVIGPLRGQNRIREKHQASALRWER